MRVEEHPAGFARGGFARGGLAHRAEEAPSGEEDRTGREPGAPRRRLVDELVPPASLFRVEAQAAVWGVTPLEAAHGLGLVADEAIAAAVARRIGGTALPAPASRLRLAADPGEWREVLARGMVAVDRPVGGKAILVAAGPATAEDAVRRLASAGQGLPLLVTTQAAFSAAVRDWAQEQWLDEAVNRLKREEPGRSAADRPLMRRVAASVAFGLLALLACLAAGPDWLAVATGHGIGLVVVAWVAIRLAAAAVPSKAMPRRTLAPDALPRYSILCALYRETAVVGALMAALARLDYPRAKLDIKMVLEADDEETQAAIRRAPPHPAVEIIVVPPVGPRTKPKALMAALPFATGDLIVVFDAEDRPGRAQLREAAEVFAAADERLGCLQAPLSAVNTQDGWLACFFAAEYDALFRLLLPAFARLGLPMPLGGTSNHFRRAALTQALGWDPCNVTEDADLGFRLARNGWRVGTLSTATREEAPKDFRGWLGQRSRWFKGWLQTTAVLCRQPRRLLAELGIGGIAVLIATLAGSIGSALIHLVCILALVIVAAFHGWPAWTGLAATVFALGYGGSILYKLAGLARAGRLGLAPWLLLIPLAWLAMGLAALRAVVDLWRRPFHWEKTAHGDAAWPAAAEDAALPDHSTEAIGRIVALSEQAMARGTHSPADVAAALARHSAHILKAGADPDALALIDRYRMALEARAALS